MIKIIEIKKWMKRKIITANKDESVVKASKIMSKNNVGSLVVVDKKKPIGIITETDILKRVVAKNLNLLKTKVKDVMTKKLITVPSNYTFMKISRKMGKNKIKHIVIKEKGKMVGIITSTDIIKLMSGYKKR